MVKPVVAKEANSAESGMLRFQESASADESDVFTEQPKIKFRAVYKFNEGSSSAVRKPIKMSALM